MPGIAVALGKWALGEAQAVTAHRAELRSSSPALLAALHSGTAGGQHLPRTSTSICRQDTEAFVSISVETGDSNMVQVHIV